VPYFRHYDILLSTSALANDKVSCFFPSLNTTNKAFHILVPHGYIFGCLTGSARFLGSGSVKNDLLIVG